MEKTLLDQLRDIREKSTGTDPKQVLDGLNSGDEDAKKAAREILMDAREKLQDDEAEKGKT